MSRLTSELCKWVDENIEQGADKNTIFKVLFDDGVDYNDIAQYMKYTPSIPLEDIENPLSEVSYPDYADIPQGTLFLPNARECIDGESRVLCVDGFLNRDEIARLSQFASGDAIHKHLLSEQRDSTHQFNYEFSKLDSHLIDDIDARICSYIGLDPVCGSELLLQSLEHVYDDIATDAYLDMSVFSVAIFLTDGYMDFPRLSSKFLFKQGDLVFWQNKQPNGQADEQMCYLYTPSAGQTQRMLVKRFELDQTALVYRKTLNEMVQNYTQVGIEKVRLNESFFETLSDFYHANRVMELAEFDGEDDFIKSEDTTKTPSSLINLPDDMCEYIHQQMKPILEQWAGVELDPTYVYGIRTYHDGATLMPHRDRIATHIISCIINVYQDVDMPWPLQIDDNYYRSHAITFEPGEAVLYESARLDHSRIEPLRGRAYANIFCHFKPKDYTPPKLD